MAMAIQIRIWVRNMAICCKEANMAIHIRLYAVKMQIWLYRYAYGLIFGYGYSDTVMAIKMQI